MVYPKKFQQKVRSEFPNCEEVLRSLNDGDVSVGKFLRDNLKTVFEPEDILSATSLDELKETACSLAYNVSILTEWLKLYEEHSNI